MGSNRNCSVAGCTNTYTKALKEQRLVQFFSFPTKPWMKARREKWIAFVKRQNKDKTPWMPTVNSRICSDHFIGGDKSEDPRNPSYNPTIRILNSVVSQSNLASDRYKRIVKRLQQRNDRTSIRDSEPQEICLERSQYSSPTTKDVATQTNQSVPSEWRLTVFESCMEGNDKSTLIVQASTTSVPPTFQDTMCGPDSRCAFFGGFSTIKNDAALNQLTGISRNLFSLLLSLFPGHSSRCNELQIEDKLLLTLMRLRWGITGTSISTLFGIHKTTACRTFTTTLTHLFDATKDWIIFPSQTTVRETSPVQFKARYPSCRVIIDCTEVKTECPPEVSQRIHMYSNYKSGYTAKYLIGIAPNGLITFLSNGFGGRATDSYITNNCGILDLLDHGDTIMADKGFPNITLKEDTVLVMPPFSKKNIPQFSSNEVKETYNIASLRIHVERVIGRVKVFRIINERIPIDLLPYLDKVMHICCVLVNLSPPIVNNSEIE